MTKDLFIYLFIIATIHAIYGLLFIPNYWNDYIKPFITIPVIRF